MLIYLFIYLFIITRDLIPEKLVKHGSDMVCFNLSKGAAKIMDARETLIKFYETHKEYNVEKIILSVGTNDFRYCQKGIGHLKYFLNKLIRDTKNMFPKAKVYVQSVLPVNRISTYIGRNVINFNRLIYEACVLQHCFYIDIFSSYLNFHGYNINTLLYRDDVHLNRYGNIMLAKTYISILNDSNFNPRSF